MTSHDLLDVCEAMLLEPLRDHPEEMRKFREDHLYAPLPGTRKAKKKAQSETLAQFGVDMAKLNVKRLKGKDAVPDGENGEQE